MIRPYFASFLIILPFLYSNLLSISANTIKNSTTLPLGNYRCYVLCLAVCLKNQQDLNFCRQKCQIRRNSTNLCSETDIECWTKCKSLTTGNTEETLSSPIWKTVNYSSDPEPSPRKADLEWAPVKGARLYVLESREKDAKSERWTAMETTLTSYSFIKENLCSIYEFRVAAVNEYSVGNFAEIVEIEKPIPIIMNNSLEVISANMTDREFQDPAAEFTDNNTIDVILRYNWPPGWNISNREFRPDILSFLQDCGKCEGSRPTFSEPQPLFSFKSPIVRFSLPSMLIKCKCNYIFDFNSIQSMCGTESTFSAKDNRPTLFAFTCESVSNSNCSTAAKPKPMTCKVENLTSSFNKSTDLLSIKWSQIVNNGSRPSFYLYSIRPSKKQSKNKATYEEFAKKDLIGPLNIERVNADPEHDFIELSIPFNVSSDKDYFMQICEVYDGTTPRPINWTLLVNYRLDTDTVYNNGTGVAKIQAIDTTTLALIVIFVVLLLLVIICFLVWVILNHRKSEKPKSIDEFQLGDRLEDDENSRYVLAPRRFDHWELPRKRLIVYEDKKLGSGAFGAVYKGKVQGKLLTHANSNSILAENWMRSENCEVAVKMLPEYADDSSKSDFCKEINLMKQLGHHERLVNMLACVTADEPLCLIVEYCSEGDLLHYLRDRRKYMIKLEQSNIDTNDVINLDTNMILCLKDLFSFAWQICAGMEYLTQKGFIHRDLAARNILVDKGKKAKIGDFGLCRFSCSDQIYVSKGGRLPLKWMAIEAIKNYEFTSKSDVWSYGVLLFEIITLGGSPYPGVQPAEMEALLDSGKRMDKPDNCPDQLYQLMLGAWQADPENRPSFTLLSEKLREMLEQLTEDYSYLSLNQKLDYYNVAYGNSETTNQINQEAESTNQNSSSTNGVRLGQKGLTNPAFFIDTRLDYNSDNSLLENSCDSKSADSKPIGKGANFGSRDSRGTASADDLRSSIDSDRPLVTPKSSIKNGPITNESDKNLIDFGFLKLLKPTNHVENNENYQNRRFSHT